MSGTKVSVTFRGRGRLRRARPLLVALALLGAGLVPLPASTVAASEAELGGPDDLLYQHGWRQRHLLESIRLPDAWDVTAPVEDVTIAVLDTGVDLDHPDLDAQLLPGWDFVNDDPDPMDDHGQGTAAAGVAAAATNNQAGIAGTAWGAQILPVKVLNSKALGTPADVAAGIDFAIEKGADVISLSYAGKTQSDVLDESIGAAVAQDIVVIAAAGDSEWLRFDAEPTDSPSLLAVGATSWSGDVTFFSNRGEWVDLAAPGYEVTSTELVKGPVEKYGFFDGTAIVAGFVAGAAALIRDREPELMSCRCAIDSIDTAGCGPDGIDPHYGHGLLDVGAALGESPLAESSAAAPDAFEPNPTPYHSAALDQVDGDTYPAGGTFSPESDVDWYRLDVPSWVTELDIDLTHPYDADSPLRTDPLMTVLDPDLRPVLVSSRRSQFRRCPRSRPLLLQGSEWPGVALPT